MTKPDSCSSTACTSQGSNYCKQCSHGNFFGKGDDDAGNTHYWTFSPRFGPLFTDAEYDDLEDQPTEENDPCWQAFDGWNKKRMKS